MTPRPSSDLDLPAAPRTADGPGPEHARFCAARRLMLDRLGEWLETRPAAADADMEVEGTVTLVRAMATLRTLAERRG